MECNRDEAIRAKEIAEKKMQSDDFEGARKIALKAKQLFPELDNIFQLLAVCDVHCSAQNIIWGSEKDWYGILQVERLADEITIKKQYRRLALVLHPDKNKFPGAEAAFKLIGEANMVLSDQAKRSLYDYKCRSLSRTAATKPPPSHSNQNKPYGAQNKFPDVSKSTSSGLNRHQPTKPNSFGSPQSFWTCCSFCYIKYQYAREFVNRALRCQNCSKPFIAFDLGSAPGSNGGQSAFSRQKQCPTQGAFKVGPEVKFSRRTVVPEPMTKPVNRAKVNDEGIKANGKENVHVKESVMPKVNEAKPRESGALRDTSIKRGRRKMVKESTESSDTASSDDTEEVVIEENGGDCPRKSTRQRQRVSYIESTVNDDDDDFTSLPKRSWESKSSLDGKGAKKEESFGNNESKVGYLAAADVGDRKIDKKTFTLFPDAIQSNVDDSESKSNMGCTSDPEFYECLDPEFSDFDKDKEEKCFSVDQIWACYDTFDGMPRFYAKVRKVNSHGFKLWITWLEPDPQDQGEVDWVNEGLPMACGKYTHGDSEATSDRLMFSHQIRFQKGSKRGSYDIYPRIGETWALFKDWDIKWSSDPENHKKCDFEIVEVLSDFCNDAGFWIAYLEKVKGFVSLFQRTYRGGIASFLILSSEVLRFSHRIPSFKMNGKERDGVPEGSFELDPASLPSDLMEFLKPDEVKMETQRR